MKTKNGKEVETDKVYKLEVTNGLFELFTIQKIGAKQIDANYAIAFTIKEKKMILYSEAINVKIHISMVKYLEEATEEEINLYSQSVEGLRERIDYVAKNIYYN